MLQGSSRLTRGIRRGPGNGVTSRSQAATKTMRGTYGGVSRTAVGQTDRQA
jgi:hypothetical protein